LIEHRPFNRPPACLTSCEPEEPSRSFEEVVTKLLEKGAGWELATPDSFDRTFQFCRIVFRGAPWGDGGGWGVDFPRADVNLSIRLSELTTVRVGMGEAGEPNHLLLRFIGFPSRATRSGST
jgi:hypothetical protein